MEKILRQDEIDALFSAAHSENREPEQVARSRVVPYSFSNAGQINNEQMRAISLLNDLFARNLTHNLGAWLRTRFQVNLVSAEQMSFNEFLLRIPDLCYVSSVRLEPLGALSVLQLDLSLVPPMIDLLLGGEGKPGAVREMTDIEEAILSSVTEVICRELSSAWQPVGLSFVFERRQMQTQIARLMPVTEKTLCLSFEIRMSGSAGLLNLAFPAVVSNTILRRLVGDWGRHRRHSLETRQRIEEQLRQVRLGGSLQLPAVRVAAQELAELMPGRILSLRMASNQSAELRISGVPLARAWAVRSGERRAAHLTTMATEEGSRTNLHSFPNAAATQVTGGAGLPSQPANPASGAASAQRTSTSAGGAR